MIYMCRQMVQDIQQFNAIYRFKVEEIIDEDMRPFQGRRYRRQNIPTLLLEIHLGLLSSFAASLVVSRWVPAWHHRLLRPPLVAAPLLAAPWPLQHDVVECASAERRAPFPAALSTTAALGPSPRLTPASESRCAATPTGSPATPPPPPPPPLPAAASAVTKALTGKHSSTAGRSEESEEMRGSIAKAKPAAAAMMAARASTADLYSPLSCFSSPTRLGPIRPAHAQGAEADAVRNLTRSCSLRTYCAVAPPCVHFASAQPRPEGLPFHAALGLAAPCQGYYVSQQGPWLVNCSVIITPNFHQHSTSSAPTVFMTPHFEAAAGPDSSC